MTVANLYLSLKRGACLGYKKMLATLEESSNLRQAEQDRERDLVVSSSVANAPIPRSAISSPRALAQSATRLAMSRSSEASTTPLSVRRPSELSSYDRTAAPASSLSCAVASRPDESDNSFDSSFESDTEDSIEIEEEYDGAEDGEEYEEESDEEEEYSEY